MAITKIARYSKGGWHMKTIYSLEDDEDIGKIIRVSLNKAGFNVESFTNASDFLDARKKAKPDRILLDLRLPDVSGRDILKSIRANKENDSIRIIIISAKRRTIDKVEGLDSGADDYIEKPFDILELISRVNARFRNDQHLLSKGNLVVDIDNHNASLGQTQLKLTNREFELLKIFLKNQGKVIRREEIFSRIYNQDSIEMESRAIDRHIASLRKKIGDKSGKIIRTIYGVGYIRD